MSEPTHPGIRFALGVTPRVGADGEVGGYTVQAVNAGLSKEAVLIVVKNWLRLHEKDYFDQFKQSFQD